MTDAPRRARLGHVLATALVVGVLSVACCPVPAASADTPTAFSATVGEVDANGYWAVARDGTPWRVAGAPPAATGERIYLEGVWTSAGTFRIDRVSALPER